MGLTQTEFGLTHIGKSNGYPHVTSTRHENTTGVQPDLRQLALRQQHQLGQLRSLWWTIVKCRIWVQNGVPSVLGIQNMGETILKRSTCMTWMTWGCPPFRENSKYMGNNFGITWFEGTITRQHNLLPEKHGAFWSFFSDFSPEIDPLKPD